MASNHNPSVTIQMYRQGLGDCFLLTVEETGKEALHMLIDCGLLQGTENGTAIMQQVVADIESKLKQSPYDPVQKFLDVVVLTHEHTDHISGFIQAQDIFKRIDFGEVWASWLDDESHPNYKLVRERFNKQLVGLETAVTQMKGLQIDICHDCIPVP